MYAYYDKIPKYLIILIANYRLITAVQNYVVTHLPMPRRAAYTFIAT